MAERMTNRQFAEQDKQFRGACSEAHVAPTKRQASKFRRREGVAFQSWANAAPSKSVLKRQMSQKGIALTA